MLTRLDAAALDTIREKIQDTVPDLVAIYQFGSSVQGGEHAESDLDLAFLLSPRFPISSAGNSKRI